MSKSLRSKVCSLGAALLLLSCENTQNTDQLVEARLNAEKVKELQAQNQELKTANEELLKENGALKGQLEALRSKQAAADQAQRSSSRVATRSSQGKSRQQANEERKSKANKPSAEETEALREQATGGSGFK